MSFHKTYFLCPTSDFIHPPPAGPLSLGSIIRSTSAPQVPLNSANIVPVANANPTTLEIDWKKTVSAKTGLGLGVYAQFLQLATGGLQFGPGVDIDHSRQTTHTFIFDKMTTVSFEPTSQYIKEAVQAPAVQSWLREPKQRFSPVNTLFLVTGMKLVNGAKIMASSSVSVELNANAGLDAVPLGITIGPKGHWTSSRADETEFIRNSEFVFAFQVKRLRFGRKVEAQEYNQGAFLAYGHDEKDCYIDHVLVEDMDGSSISNAYLVADASENAEVYCVTP